MKLEFFKQDRRKRIQDQSLATLQSLLQASRTDVSPQDTLAELMDLGNRELRGENYAARRAAEAASQSGPAYADTTEPAEPTEDARVTELSMTDLARVLEASHTDAAPQNTLAELMDTGNGQRRGEDHAARPAAKAESQPGPANNDTTEPTEEDAVTELSITELALLLDASHTPAQSSEAGSTTEEDP